MSAERLYPEGTQLGRDLGYPECCIDFFALRALGLGFGLRIPVPEQAPLFGTGYVPCPKCMFKSEDELLAIIQANRKIAAPFPDYEESEHDSPQETRSGSQAATQTDATPASTPAPNHAGALLLD